MPLVTLKCSRCGAELPPTRPGESCTCAYCGQTFTFDAPPPQSQPFVEAPSIAEVFSGQPPSVRPASLGASAAILGGIGVLLLVGLLTTILVDTTAPLRRATAAAVARTTDPADRRFLWDGNGGPPQLASAGGREILVARFREGADDQLYVEAREPPALGRVWRVGPFGSYSEGCGATWFQVVHDRVAVTEVRAKVHVYALASGAELGTFPLSDRPTDGGLCSMADDQLLIATADGKRWVIDVRAPALRRAGREDRCAGPASRRAANQGAPRLPGFRADRVLVAKDLGVAVGHRDPGTPVPRAVGFDPGSGAVRWTADLAGQDPTLAEEATGESADLLEGGRLVASFQQKSAYRLSAFDARTGQRLWEAPLPPNWKDWEPQLIAGDRYFYMGCTMGLAALDPASGRIAGYLSPFKLSD